MPYLTYLNILLLVISSSYLFLHNTHHHVIVNHLTYPFFGFLWSLTCMLTIWRKQLCLPWPSHFKHWITSYWMNIVSLKGRWRKKMAIFIQYGPDRESFILMARIILSLESCSLWWSIEGSFVFIIDQKNKSPFVSSSGSANKYSLMY